MAEDEKPPKAHGVGRAGSLAGPTLVQLTGVAAKGEAGEIRVVSSTGIATGDGDAHGVGSSIAEATGTASGAGDAHGVGSSIAAASGNAAGSNRTISPEAASIRISGQSPKVEVTEAANTAEGSFKISGINARMAATEAPDTAEFRGVVFNPQIAAARFEALEAQVRTLEIVLRSSRPFQPPGPGHNQGPPITAEDENEIKQLIALLKEQRPATVVKRDELVAAANRASKVAEKIKRYTDEFFLAAAKKSGEKFGENLVNPIWWLGVVTLITSVVGGLHSWLEAIPIH